MLWNEHHAVRKSHDATHKENVLKWCISGVYHVIGLKQTRGIKNVALKAAKKNRGCRGLLGRVILFMKGVKHMSFYLDLS